MVKTASDKPKLLSAQRIQAYDKVTGLNAVRAFALDLRSAAAEKDRQLQAVGAPCCCTVVTSLRNV